VTDFRVLRPVRTKHGRTQVAHIFSDEDYWFPYRSGLCGKEIAAERLTSEGAEEMSVCQSCSKRLARAEEAAA
jgi:hypothetical protein